METCGSRLTTDDSYPYELLRDIVNNLSAGVAILALDGRYIHANAVFCDMMERDLEALSEMTFHEFSAPDDLDEAGRAHEDLVTGRTRSYRRRAHVVAPDGSPAWADISSVCLHDPDGSPRYIIMQVESADAQVAAEEELRRLAELGVHERERLRSTLDSLFDPLVIYEAVRDSYGRVTDFRYLDANAAACVFEHQHHDTLVELTLFDIHPAAHTTGLYDRLLRVVETGEPLVLNDYIYPLESLGSEERRYDIRAVRVSDGLAMTWRDVTDRYAATERISNSERRLHIVLDSMLDPHVMVRAVRNDSGEIIDFVLTAANLAACTFADRPRSEVVGLPVFGDFLQAAGPKIVHMLARVLETGESLAIDNFSDSVAGSEEARHFDLRAVRVGESVSLMFREVTSRYRAARALKESEERLRLAMENSGVGSCLLSPEGRYLTVNPALCKILGRDEETLLSLSFQDVTYPEDVDSDTAQFNDLVEGRISQYQLRKRYQRPDGSMVWAELSVGCVRNDDGSARYLVVQIIDVTARVIAEEALRRSEELQRFLLQLSDALRPLSDPMEVQVKATRILRRYLGAARTLYAEVMPDAATAVAYSDARARGVPSVAGEYMLADFGVEVWERLKTGETVSCDDIDVDFQCAVSVRDFYASHGVKAYITVPLVKAGRLMAVLIVHHSEPRVWTSEEVNLVEVVAQRTWDAVERARVEKALRESQAELELSLELTRVAHDQAEQELRTTRVLLQAAEILAVSVDSARLFSALSRILMDATHARVVISRWDEAHREVHLVATAGDVPWPVGATISWNNLGTMIQRAIRERVTKVLDFDISQGPVQDGIDEYDARLILQVPIVFRKKLIGLIALDEPGMRREFSEREIALVEGIAAQAAVALENARLYEAEHGIAETLQETLTVVPPSVPGVAFSRAYQSATHQIGRVGGDFVDIFEVHDHVVGITLGDVSGKGVDAAVTTAMIRNTLRAYALDGKASVDDVIGKANHVLCRFTADESFVTLWFGLLNTETGRLHYVAAGHPPALVLAPDGGVRELVCCSPILGVFEEAEYKTGTVDLAFGERLILYSDGVSEARSPAGEFFGTKGLLDILEGNQNVATLELSDVIMDGVMAFSEGVLRDDVAIFVAEWEGKDGDNQTVRVARTGDVL